MNEENGVVVVVKSGSIQSDKRKLCTESNDENKTTFGINEEKELPSSVEEIQTKTEAAFQDVREVHDDEVEEEVKQSSRSESDEKAKPSSITDGGPEALPKEADGNLQDVDSSTIENEDKDEDKKIDEAKQQAMIIELAIPTMIPLVVNKDEEDGGKGMDVEEANDDGQGQLEDIDETKIALLQKDEKDENTAEGQMEIIVPIIEDEKMQDQEDVNESAPDNKESAEYACDQCDKKFTHLSSRKRHMLKHQSGDTPAIVYQCLACSKTFNYNSSLKRHLRLHTEEANGKAYSCKECAKTFMYSTSLKRHLKTHSGKEIFPCPHCHRCFEYISSLKRHEKLHVVGKGFKCESCLKCFGYLSSLTRHQRIHQKSLSCEKCDKQFRFQKSYIKHMEEHGIAKSELKIDGDMDETTGKDDDDEMNVDECGEKHNEAIDESAKDDGAEAQDAIEAVKMNADDHDDNANESHDISEVLQGEVLDLQAAENHPFVKFVVSQNALSLDQLQSIHAQPATQNDGDEANIVTTSAGNVTFALVQADDGTVVENSTLVTEEGQSFTNASVGGIVLVELDQNNKVTERHVEGLQASNLLQLLQAVEGYAVEQAVCLDGDNQENNQETNENMVAVKENAEEANETEETS